MDSQRTTEFKARVMGVGMLPAKIMIVSDFPGEDDIKRGEALAPLPGRAWNAGNEFNKMAEEAGIYRSQCFVTCAIKERPPNDDLTLYLPEKKKEMGPHHILLGDRMVAPVVRDSIELLKREIESCRPNVIIALGNAAMWALTGEWGITKWRGSQLDLRLTTALDYTPVVVPTYHPGMVLRQWSWRPIAIQDLRRANRFRNGRPPAPPAKRYTVDPSIDQVGAVLHQLWQGLEAAQGQCPIAVDIETRAYKMVCISLTWSLTESICIPFMHVDDEGKNSSFWPEEYEYLIVFALYKLMTHPNFLCVGQNFLYDAQYIMREWHFCPANVRDIMIDQHTCFSNMQKSLDFQSSMYCENYKYWKDDSKEWDPAIGEKQLWIYNCDDGTNTLENYYAHQRNIPALGLSEVAEFQQSLFFPVLRTMVRGVRADKEKRNEYRELLEAEIKSREDWMTDLLGHPLNIQSPKQMQTLFYGDFKQKPIFDRKTKRITCNDEALRAIAWREPLLRTLVKVIQELRSLNVFLSTFVMAPLDIDGRIRCSFNICGTETYRFSSSKNAFGSGMNMQNIPKGGAGEDPLALELPNIRELFIPDHGMEFFDIDLSSADLRIVVWESDEQEMKAMLREGLDPYTEIAKEFYRDPTITKKDPRRQTFKGFAHGTNYLGTPKGLAERMGLSVSEAERTQAWYFGKFPRIKKWQDNLKAQVEKRRFVENAFGYRNYFFDRIEGTIYNQAAAWIPQSTVACIINRAYVAIDQQLEAVEICMQVHDSLAGQFPINRREDCIANILRLAEITIPYDDPLIIPVGIKTSTKSWGDCE